MEDIKSFNGAGDNADKPLPGCAHGREKYWKELFAALREERNNLKIDRLSLDIFSPVDEEFAREVSSIGKPVML